MPRETLQKALDALHHELESVDTLSDEDRASLLTAMEEIRAALSSPDGEAEPTSGALSARVYGLIEELEATHPKFAEILRNVSESLSNLGI